MFQGDRGLRGARGAGESEAGIGKPGIGKPGIGKPGIRAFWSGWARGGLWLGLPDGLPEVEAGDLQSEIGQLVEDGDILGDVVGEERGQVAGRDGVQGLWGPVGLLRNKA